ncbi:hypothetical protein B0H11DRAFT_1918789 [Mycena galericulata]|nr:hypothetical protein B0H11DRAFT_1918789 [Mycena galericulata]
MARPRSRPMPSQVENAPSRAARRAPTVGTCRGRAEPGPKKPKMGWEGEKSLETCTEQGAERNLNLMPSRPDHAELEAVEPHLFFKFFLQMLGGIQTPDGETQYSGLEGDIIDKRDKKMRVEMQ